MSYADLTWNDPNAVKRWLQHRRIRDALDQIGPDQARGLIVDFGGGDGMLAEVIQKRWPGTRVVVFEPYAEMAEAARRRLDVYPTVSVVEREVDLPPGADVIFCTEVFEHLPDVETDRALDEIDRILKAGGRLVIGVPVEVGPPALLKGLFRHWRRAGAYDADLGRIWQATTGRAPTDRPPEMLGPDRKYHSFHLGFDHRQLRRRLEERFGHARLTGSPFRIVPVFLNSEAYLTLTKPETVPYGPRRTR